MKGNKAKNYFPGLMKMISSDCRCVLMDPYLLARRERAYFRKQYLKYLGMKENESWQEFNDRICKEFKKERDND